MSCSDEATPVGHLVQGFLLRLLGREVPEDSNGNAVDPEMRHAEQPSGRSIINAAGKCHCSTSKDAEAAAGRQQPNDDERTHANAPFRIKKMVNTNQFGNIRTRAGSKDFGKSPPSSV